MSKLFFCAGLDKQFKANGPFEVALNKSESQHIAKALRYKVGQEITLVCSDSEVRFKAVITSNKNPITVKVVAPEPKTPTQSKLGCVAFALLKGNHNDILCEKATEIGAKEILFWSAERSIVRLNKERAKERLKRLQRISKEACQQCGRSDKPSIIWKDSSNSVLEYLNTKNKSLDLFLCCSTSPSASLMREVEFANSTGSQIHLIVGPEGDFSNKEETEICDFGFLSVSLGPLILRAETAGICAMSQAQGLWGWRQGS